MLKTQKPIVFQCFHCPQITSKGAPTHPQGSPKTPRDPPGSHPRTSKDFQTTPRDSPKTLRGPQGLPRDPQGTSQSFPGTSKDPLRRTRGPPGALPRAPRSPRTPRTPQRPPRTPQEPPGPAQEPQGFPRKILPSLIGRFNFRAKAPCSLVGIGGIAKRIQ